MHFCLGYKKKLYKPHRKFFYIHCIFMIHTKTSRSKGGFNSVTHFYMALFMGLTPLRRHIVDHWTILIIIAVEN